MTPTIDCTQALAATTGLIDVPDEVLKQARRHVATCERCRSAATDDDAAGRVLPTVKVRHPGLLKLTRALLLTISVAQFGLALPWLVGANWFHLVEGTASSEHLTRDGAIGVAMASLGIVAVWRSRWSVPASAVAVLLLVLQVATGVVDQHEGKVALHFEVTHVGVVAIALLLGLMAVLQKASPQITRRRSRALTVARESRNQP